MARRLLFVLVTTVTLVCTTIANSQTRLPVQGGAGGNPFESTCSGDFVVGVHARAGSWIDAIGLKCGTFIAQTGKFKQPAWNKPFHGSERGTPQQRLCPADHYVRGMRWGYTAHNPNPFVEFVELLCSPVNGEKLINVCLGTGQGCQSGHRGGGAFGESPHRQLCPPDQAVTGIRGRSGLHVDALGLICGPKPKIVAAASPPPPRRPLGKHAVAIKDVDIYDGPDGTKFKIIGMMRAGSRAGVMQRVPVDGGTWCKLMGVAPGGVDGWVWGGLLKNC